MTATPLNPPNVVAPRTFVGKLGVFASDIKIHHTVFALPFALLSTFLAARGMPAVGQLLLIMLCMASARTVAMAANRLLDASFDARNPRTARRAIPSGALSRSFYLAGLLLCAAMFVAAAWGFDYAYANPWPLRLSLPVLAYVCGYPLLKRFSRLCHYYLGLALGLAPVCAWVAVRGDLELPPVLMALGVLFWTAGFDILYACQDYEIDVREGLFSVPARLGIARALWVARLTHVLSAAALAAVGLSTPLLGGLYFTGVALAVVLLVVEHSLVRADDLSKISLAFFTVNGVISLALGTLGIIDVFVRR